MLTALMFVPSILAMDDPNAWDAIVTAITGSVSVSTVSAVLVSAIGAAIALVFFWWAARKVTGVIMGAFRGGHLGI